MKSPNKSNNDLSLLRFESMLKTNSIYFFDSVEFEEIIYHYIDSGKHSLAKKAVKLGMDQHPSSILLKLLQSELLIFENKFQEAFKLLDAMFAIEPHNEEIYIQKATILSKTKRHLEAIELLKIALAYVNEEADILAMIGMEYLFLDKFDQARLNFAKCLEVDFDDYSSLYNVIYCFDMEDKHEEAIQYLENYIDKDPYSEAAWHQLGRQFFVQENYKQAIRAYDYAILIDENFVGAYLEKAKSLESLGQFEDAIENYLITIKLEDPTSFAYLRIGECHEKLQNNHLATQYYLKTVNEDPLLDKGWMALTTIYFKQEDYQKALYYLNKAISIDENNPLYWRKHAEIYIKISLFEEAVIAFKNCIKLEDTSLNVWVSLADVLFYIGEYEETVEILNRAKLEYLNFAEIEYRLFGLYSVLGNALKAKKHLLKGLKIDFEYHKVMKDIFPLAFNSPSSKKIIQQFQAS